jgi:RNA polymerase primary sigma factor
MDTGNVIRLPVHLVESITALRAAQQELHDQMGREASVEEIAEQMGCRIDKVRRILQAADVQPLSLDARPRTDNADSERTVADTVVDFSSDTSALAEEHLLREELLRAIYALDDERQIKVLVLRYGLKDGRYRTLEEVGAEFGITRERIRQIEQEALRKLRHPAYGAALRAYLEGAAA